MSEQSSVRYGWLVSLVGLLMWAGIAMGICIAGVAVYLTILNRLEPLIGIAMVLVGFLTIPLWIVIYGFLTLMINTEEDLQDVGAQLTSVVAELRSVQRTMDQVGQNVLLSEASKQVLSRDKERELLRQAIMEDLANRDWEGAHHLIEQMEHRLGNKKEAEFFRLEVQRHKSMTDEQQIAEGIQRIEVLMDRLDWDQARKEIDRLVRRFENDNRVRALPGELEVRREKRKRRLLTEFDEAFRRGDVDLAGTIIRQLDGYLSKNEAAALEEAARGVFRAHLHQLGVQFSLAVSEKNWRRALNVGIEIMEAYPNSRFAREVRERLDVLKERAAAETQAAPAPAPAPSAQSGTA